MKKVFVTILLLVVAPALASACYNRCEQGICVTKAFVTWQDCHMSGPVCIDDPVWGECAGPQVTTVATVTLGDIYGAEPTAQEAAPIACTP